MSRVLQFPRADSRQRFNYAKRAFDAAIKQRNIDSACRRLEEMLRIYRTGLKGERLTSA